MSLELAGPRVIAPFFGTSMLVWASMISTVFICITLGYFAGGILANRLNKSNDWLIVRLLFSSALSLCFIALTKDYILQYIHSLTDFSRILKTIIASTLLYVIPIFLLSIIPILISRVEIKAEENKAKTLSIIFSSASIGGLLGIWVSTLILIPHLGSNIILYFISSLLFISVALFTSEEKWLSLFSLLSCLYIFYSIYQFSIQKKSYIDIDSAYNRILIFDDPSTQTKVLQLNNHINSAFYPNNPDSIVYRYNRIFAAEILQKEKLKKILVLGGAGYSLTKYLQLKNPTLKIDVVEIDEKLTRLAKSEFKLKNAKNTRFFNEDAKTYLNNSSELYDAIIWDVFSSAENIPDHLTTIETGKSIKKILNPFGLLYINTLSSLKGKNSTFLKSELKTYHHLFSNLKTHNVSSSSDSTVIQNILIQASNQNHTSQVFFSINSDFYADAFVLTDQYCPASYLNKM